MWPFTCWHKWSQFGEAVHSGDYGCCVQARKCKRCGAIEVRAIPGSGTANPSFGYTINNSLTNGGQSDGETQS